MSTEYVKLNDIEITVEITSYTEGKPMLIYGDGFGDCFPPEPEEIEFTAYYPDGTEVTDMYLLDGILEMLP